MIPDIHGEIHGVRFVKRGADDRHVIIQLLGEDDGNWFEHDTSFSSAWLDDLINVLQFAKIALANKQNFVPEKYGYRFKHRSAG